MATAESMRLVMRPGLADGKAQYYGVRTLLRGRNPYSQDDMYQTWHDDRAPLRNRAGGPGMWYANAPNLLLVLWPAAVMPYRWGSQCVTFLCLVASAASAILLAASSRRRWPTWLLLLFTAYSIAIAHNCLERRQVSPLMMFCVAAAFLSLRRGRSILAGVVLSVGLAKPTLTGLYPVWLGAKRRWLASGTAIVLFFLSCVLILAPVGVLSAAASYAHNIPALANFNDPSSGIGAVQTSIRQLAANVASHNRAIENALTSLGVIAVIAFAARALYHRRRSTSHLISSLELGAVTLSNLCVFYNRNYAAAILPLAAFGLIEHGMSPDARALRSWQVTTILMGALSFGPSVASRLSIAPMWVLPSLTLATCLSYWWLVAHEPATSPSEALA